MKKKKKIRKKPLNLGKKWFNDFQFFLFAKAFVEDRCAFT